MAKDLAPPAGGIRGRGGAAGGLEPRVTEYLTTVVQNAKNSNLSTRNLGELRTVAETLDAMLAGRIAESTDILMQRFKALEAMSHGLPWKTAAKLEITPEASASSMSHAEREAIANLELREQRLLGGQNTHNDSG